MYNHLYHYALMALTTSVICCIAGIANGLVSMTGIRSIVMQPHAQSKITRALLLGSALTDTASLIALVITSLFISHTTFNAAQPFINYGEVGALLGLLIAGTVVTIATSLPARAACNAIARQPLFAQEIQRLMLVTQSLIQTPLIFAFIIAFMIKGKLVNITNLAQAVHLAAAGLCIGLSSIGPTIGLGLFTKNIITSLGYNRSIYKKIVMFTFMSATIIESPLIFSFVITLLILKAPITHTTFLVESIGCLFAALIMAIGTLGSGISLGLVARKACASIMEYPEQYNDIRKVSLISQIFIETISIYSFLIAAIILLKK